VQGIDPALFLVVPRVVAFALSSFCLGMVFLVTAVLVGYFAGHSVGAVRLSLYQFLDNLLRAMGPAEYVLLPLKTLAVGFIVGVTTSLAALAGPGGGEGRGAAHGARLRAVGARDLRRQRRDQRGVIGSGRTEHDR
jgi:ABC-type transporter Mla maintaining outer membrane lipid asymmetry permease subunit MlaE